MWYNHTNRLPNGGQTLLSAFLSLCTPTEGPQLHAFYSVNFENNYELGTMWEKAVLTFFDIKFLRTNDKLRRTSIMIDGLWQNIKAEAYRKPSANSKQSINVYVNGRVKLLDRVYRT
jgi:hypothetical protein